MSIPLFSIFSLVTELLVTASVLYVIYRAYHENIFLRGLAFATLVYELLFNITYMLSRLLHHLPEHAHMEHGPYVVGVAIFHGIFSPIMFIALIVFFLYAAAQYKSGVNYFELHPRLTGTFVGAWLVSICSGIVLFYLLYLV